MYQEIGRALEKSVEKQLRAALSELPTQMGKAIPPLVDAKGVHMDKVDLKSTDFPANARFRDSDYNIYLTDDQGSILSVNGEACNLTERSESKLVSDADGAGKKDATEGEPKSETEGPQTEEPETEEPEIEEPEIEEPETEEADSPDNPKKASGCPLEGSNGHWDGDRGNSVWHPASEYTPPAKRKSEYNNPDRKTWGELLDKYGIEGIPFADGEPDFSSVARGTVEIDDFSDDRDDNFTSADIQMALQKGCTPEEVRKWRKENNYTWHECKDMKTMQKVPNEIHANISHTGGISEVKKEQGD